MRLPAVTAESRSITPVANSEKTVTLVEPIVWLDAPFGDTKGVRFPEGVYRLEAEDADYLYFRAPAAIEHRILKDGAVIDGRDIPGGLMLSKHLISLVPAGAYIDGESENQKVQTMRLGREFMRFEGSKWKRNY